MIEGSKVKGVPTNIFGIRATIEIINGEGTVWIGNCIIEGLQTVSRSAAQNLVDVGEAIRSGNQAKT